MFSLEQNIDCIFNILIKRFLFITSFYLINIRHEKEFMITDIRYYMLLQNLYFKKNRKILSQNTMQTIKKNLFKCFINKFLFFRNITILSAKVEYTKIKHQLNNTSTDIIKYYFHFLKNKQIKMYMI